MNEHNTVTESVTFMSGNFRLKGTLHLPATEKPPVVIGSHGLFSSAASPKQIALAERCDKIGIAFFRFDHRGTGESEGKFEHVTSLDSRCEDMLAAGRILSERDDLSKRIGLFGSSFGGAVCLSAASRLNAEVLVTLAAPIRITSSEQIIETIRKSNEDAERLIGDGKNLTFDISNCLKDISDLLLFHGDKDSVIPLAHALEIFRKAKMPKRMIMLEGGDHPLSNPEHQQRFLKETALWFKAVFTRKNHKP